VGKLAIDNEKIGSFGLHKCAKSAFFASSPPNELHEAQTGQDRFLNDKTIMIDGFNLDLEKGTGVATYARNLSYELHNLGYQTNVLYGTRGAPGIDKLLAEIAFFDRNVGTSSRYRRWVQGVKDSMEAITGVMAKEVPITGKVIAKAYSSRLPYFDEIWNVPNLFNRANTHFWSHGKQLSVKVSTKPALMHWTYPLPLRVHGAKNIFTLHDLVPLRLPYTTLDIKRRYYKLIKMLLKRADHIVTVSERSKKDIVDLFGYPEDKITNTYQSVDIPEKYINKTEESVQREIEGSFNFSYKGYFLYFGAIEPKKNVGRLIEAYLASKVDTPLVIVGKLAWNDDNDLRLLKDPSIRYLEQVDKLTYTRDRIYHLDYVPFPLLVSLIRGAKAVTFPSLYEGFGLPVLEAMRLGTPVISSTEASIPEIAGDAALLVDPYDTHAISEAIRAIDSDGELRGELSKRGLKQAALFSSERYRARLTEMYDRLLK
jgi:glycosyltransferase involved in cell wall biosynthesis